VLCDVALRRMTADAHRWGYKGSGCDTRWSVYRPLILGYRTGLCSKHASRLLYVLSRVSHPGTMQTRPASIRFGLRPRRSTRVPIISGVVVTLCSCSCVAETIVNHLVDWKVKDV